jgi:RPA family protein
MSADDQGGAGRREVAYRMFAAEFDDADFSYSESDEDRAPNYVITPTRAPANRLFSFAVLSALSLVRLSPLSPLPPLPSSFFSLLPPSAL